MKKTAWSVAIYKAKYNYIDPEGVNGRYYLSGYPVDEYAQFTRYFKNEEQTQGYAERLENKIVNKLNKELKSHSEKYVVHIRAGLPKIFPDQIPQLNKRKEKQLNSR